MSNIKFNAVSPEVESVIQARLAYASENEALLSLFNGIDPTSLRPKYSHQVCTLLLDKGHQLDKHNIAFTCSGYLLMGVGENASEKAEAAVYTDTDNAIQSLEFGALVTSLFEKIQAAESDIATSSSSVYEPVLLQIPEIHVHALLLRSKAGVCEDRVLPFGSKSTRPEPTSLSMDEFLATLREPVRLAIQAGSQQ